MASSDTDDDIISSALLTASTFYQRRQVNVRKRTRNSWHVNKQLTNNSSATERLPVNRDVEAIKPCKFFMASHLRTRPTWVLHDQVSHNFTCSPR